MLNSLDSQESVDSRADVVRQLRRLCEQMTSTVERLAGDEVVPISTAEPQPTDSNPSTAEPSGGWNASYGEATGGGSAEIDWQRILFDEASRAEPNLESECRALIAGAARCDSAAMMLLGRMLVFGAASCEQLPPLLKEIGEAYYRWRGRVGYESEPFREALVRRLTEVCTSAGLGHRIEFVRIGDRYDPSRHQAITGGLELTEVRGWLVVRENGSTYTKAPVEAR